MTRYIGKPITVETIEDIIQTSEEKRTPANTTRYKIWKVIKTNKNKSGQTAKEIETKLGKTVATRTLLRLLEELVTAKQVNRYKCRCGCAYIYYP